MKSFLRLFARQLSLATQAMPGLHRRLKVIFLSLPVWLRGRQMIWDALCQLGASQKPLYVLQVGANDGDFNDPVSHFIRRHGWSGLLLEPVPFIFERLEKNYAGVPGITLANVAVSDHDGTQAFYYLDVRQGKLPPWCVGVGSFIKNEVENVCPPPHRIEDYLRCIEVPCQMMESLLSQHQVSVLDLVVIDAEGYDGRILLQLPLDRLQPRIIIYEHHLLEAGERLRCEEFLVSHGYRLEGDKWDTLAVKTVG